MNRALPVLLAAALLAPATLAQDWGNYGGNAARNGRTAACGPTAISPLWSNTDDFSIIAWHPFVEGERVFTVREAGFPQNGGSANDAVVAYDLDTGAELWRETLPFAGDTSQEWIAWIGGVDGGRLYVSRSSNGQPQPIHALDVTDGSLVWTSVATTEAWAHDGIVFAPDGDPIVGDRLSVTRIEASDGTTAWSTPRSCPVSGNCGAAASDAAVFIDQAAPGGNVVTKLDLASGAPLYSSPVMVGFTDQNSPFLSPDGGTVYFSRTQNNATVDFLFAFEDTGLALAQLWSVPVRWTTSHEHGIGDDGSIYTFLPTDELVRLDPANGMVLDSAGVLSPLGSPNLSPKTAVDRHGRVYVSNGWASNPAGDGRMWAFSADLSQGHFTLSLDRQNAGGPVLASRGTLIVCDRAGVHAYRDPFAAAEVARLGSPPNPHALLPGQTSGPLVGATWDPVIDHTSFFPGAAVDFLGLSPTALNIPTALGTLLCAVPPPNRLYVASPGVPFAVPIPDRCSLLGRTLCAQGGSFAPGTIELTNALDLVIGNL